MIINGERALAYITTIDSITELPGYDRVEYAHVGGWGVIVSKEDNFKDGSSCLFIETDSKVPENDERFGFLAKRNYKVKIQKMCKVYSQGLIMPLDLFPEISKYKVGDDVTDVLGITYYDVADNARKQKVVKDIKPSLYKRISKWKIMKPVIRHSWSRRLLKKILGEKRERTDKFPVHFPYISKTDEERIENIPWVLNLDQTFSVTEKLDGTSCTYILERIGRKRFEFYVCSRNVRQVDINQKTFDEGNIYWEMALKYNIEDCLKQYLISNPKVSYVCVQGEGVGEGIQSNPLKLNCRDLYLFNFIDSENGRYSSEVGSALTEKWGMKWVPIIDTNYQLPDDMEAAKLYADGMSVINSKVKREGVVLRNTELSFKNVSRKYLEKH